MSAQLDVIVEGYADDRVAGTVTLIRDGDAVIVVDPGMVADRALILDPLAELGVLPTAVTVVVFSHHHLDHTLHAALFPNARFHDFQAIYHGDIWEDREAEGFAVGPNTTLLETRGHTDQDISTVVRTADGLVVLTHLWWMADGPLEDPFAPDADVLRASRQRVLELQPTLIIPGHGPAFAPDASTPV
jgi:glyoxylase-like metal-dependent hydrolase (beta-lactamase superfamily II)